MDRFVITFLLLGILSSYSMFAQDSTVANGAFCNTEEFSLESESLLMILDSLLLWDSLSRVDYPCSRYDDSTLIYFFSHDTSFSQVYVYLSDSHCALIEDLEHSKILGISKFRNHPIVIYDYLDKNSFIGTGKKKKIDCLDIQDYDTNDIIDMTKFYSRFVLHRHRLWGNYYIIWYDKGRCDKLDMYYPRTIPSSKDMIDD